MHTYEEMADCRSSEDVRELLTKNKNGKVENTPNNYKTIFTLDPFLKGALKSNLLTHRTEVVRPMGWPRTTENLNDVDIQYFLLYLDKQYQLSSDKRIEGAIRIVANENRYHPIQDYLNGLQWDGQERVKYALHHFLGAEVNHFNHNMLQVYMLGAVSRVFDPGVKFEYVLCLAGDQGSGKSTFFRFLALKDDWFSDDLRRLDDENVFRKLSGHWIIEMAEMLATVNAKSIEDIKSFVSRQKDTYKVPYDIHPQDFKRQCVFGGTSNNLDFLPLDRSGNRRFLPVSIDLSQAEVHILANEAASRAYFDQMWAEIMVIYRSGKFSLKLDRETEEYLKEHMQDYMPEDTTASQILAYLESCTDTQVCSKQLYYEALGNNVVLNPKQYEIREIHSIMNNYAKDWKKFDNPRIFPDPYGRSKGWERIPEEGRQKQGWESTETKQALSDSDLTMAEEEDQQTLLWTEFIEEDQLPF